MSPGVASGWVFLPGLLTGRSQEGRRETEFSEELGLRPLM